MKEKKWSARDGRAETIVVSAAELFLREGIENVKMTDIADAAGVGVASLYRHFQTKERLAILAGAFLWKDLRALFKDELEGAAFERAAGFEKIERMLGVYRTLFREHANFLRFLSSFDDLILRKGVPPQELAEYETSVLDFYPLFEHAYREGISDGSVREIHDPKAFYDTVCHAAIALSQKLLRGNVLAADAFSSTGEIDLFLKIAAAYLKK